MQEPRELILTKVENNFVINMFSYKLQSKFHQTFLPSEMISVEPFRLVLVRLLVVAFVNELQTNPFLMLTISWQKWKCDISCEHKNNFVVFSEYFIYFCLPKTNTHLYIVHVHELTICKQEDCSKLDFSSQLGVILLTE